jgi:hypothetical protein
MKSAKMRLVMGRWNDRVGTPTLGARKTGVEWNSLAALGLRRVHCGPCSPALNGSSPALLWSLFFHFR